MTEDGIIGAALLLAIGLGVLGWFIKEGMIKIAEAMNPDLFNPPIEEEDEE